MDRIAASRPLRWLRITVALPLGLAAFSANAQGIAFPAEVHAPLPSSLLDNPCGNCLFDLERWMREWQARHKLMTDRYIEWPAAECGDSMDGAGSMKPAPPYPPDGFYGDMKCDPRRAVELFSALWSAVATEDGPGVFDKFRTASASQVNGQTEPPATFQPSWAGFAAGITGPHTLANYCDRFRALRQELQTLRYYELSSVVGDEIDHELLGKGPYLLANTPQTCKPKCSEAYNFVRSIPEPLDDDSTSYALYGVKEPPSSCNHAECLPPLTGMDGITRYKWTGRSSASSLRVRGHGHSLIHLQNEGGAQYFNPPVPVEQMGAYRIYGQFDMPDVWSRMIAGYPDPRWDELANVVNDTLPPPAAWSVMPGSQFLTIIKPDFETLPETAVSRRRGGCSTCKAGTVDASGPGVSVTISLGSWDGGDLGYLSLKGDTLTGLGDEIITGHYPASVPGKGAKEMGQSARLQLRANWDKESK